MAELEDARIVPDAGEDIAIIGVACRFPGARDHLAFWTSLREGRCSVREIPADRWDGEQYYSLDPDAENRGVSKWGGFIEGADRFDASFFRVSPREAELMDPQQRLLMELTWSCLEDAGYAPSHLRGSKTGVYVGVCNFDYKEVLEKLPIPIEAHLSTGTYGSLIANRISYEYDLRGPSVPIDTACSSSLVALHEAAMALRRGECSMALVGGVSVLCSPTYFVAFSKAGMLSPEGVCRTFDRRANGYVRGEGAGVLLLKPLRRAIQDCDRVWGVVKATAVNHGGRVQTLTSPSAFAQARVVAEAHRKARVAPDTVGYIECHGTGTPKGDPIEVHGLQRSFSSLEASYGVAPKEGSCGIGSVKTNIGHLEAAAGIAGIIKVLLCMKHQALPGLLHFSELNPRIRLEGSPFRVVERLEEWAPPTGGGPRRAGVSSFGFGGVNAHAVLEEHSDPPAAATAGQGGALFVLSARTSERLRAYAQELREHLASGVGRDARLADIACSLRRREPMEERIAFEARSMEELESKISQVARGALDFEGGYRGSVRIGAGASRAGIAAPERGVAGQETAGTAKLWAAGVDVDWRSLEPADAAARPRVVSLPTYPFERKRYWLPHSIESTFLAGSRNVPAGRGGAAEGASALWDLSSSWVARRPRPRDRSLVEVAGSDPLCLTVLAQNSRVEATGFPPGVRRIALPARAEGEDGEAWIDACWSTMERIRSALEVSRASSLLLLSDAHDELCEVLFALLSSVQKELDIPARWYRWDGAMDHDAASALRSILEDAKDHRTVSGEKRLRYAGHEMICEERAWRARPFVPRALPPEQLEGGVYWIPGGNGSIGRKIATHLASRYHATVILSGRSGDASTAEMALRTGGPDPRGSICHRRADCTRHVEMSRLLSWIMETHGRLDGVVHAAGTLRDRGLFSKSAQDVRDVLAPKVEGALVLDEVTKQCRLDFFVLFSSITALWGNAGQSDYAAANAFLRAFTHRRRERVARGERHGETSVIHWPYWEHGGMRMTREHVDLLEANLGVQPFKDEDGVAVFEHVIAARAPEACIVRGAPTAILAALDKLGPSPAGEPAPEPRPAHGPEAAAEGVQASVTRLVAELTGLTPDRIVPGAHFAEYGVDSILLQKLARRLSDVLGRALTAVDLHNHPSILELSEMIAGEAGASASSSSSAGTLPRPKSTGFSGSAPGKARLSDDVAIIGVDLQASGVGSPDELWGIVMGSPRSPSPYPEERWCLLPREATIGLRREDCPGFFLQDALRFDHQLFGVSPREAMLMDPQQRLLLHSVWRAIDSAGYSRKEFARRPTSLFLSIDAIDYEHLTGREADVDEFTATGVSRYIAANRISRTFDLRGLSETVGTACSSFFVGLGRAVEAMRDGTAEQAVVAAVQLNLLPSRFRLLRERGLLSPDGMTRPFDRVADGFVRSEGVGAVLLKPLWRALEDGDRVHAVIKGVGVWHAGTGMGVTAPSSAAHQEAMRRAMARASIPPEGICYLEGHGTGMNVGDASEIDAIQRVFHSLRRAPEAPCFLGAAKSVLGHMESASGVAALVKVVLALRERMAPGLPHLGSLCAELDPASGLRVSRQPQPLPEPIGAAGRCAGLLSYGLGGVSAFVVVQEYRRDGGDARSAPVARPGLFVVSAQSEARLDAYLSAVHGFLSTAASADRGVDFQQMIEAYQCHREHMPHRMAIAAQNVEELRSKLAAVIRGEAVDGMWRSSASAVASAGVAGEAPLANGPAAEGRLQSLAAAWVGGAQVPWPSGVLERSPFPGYPFEGVRQFWVSQKGEARGAQSSAPGT